jgi:hypothetical protein
MPLLYSLPGADLGFSFDKRFAPDSGPDSGTKDGGDIPEEAAMTCPSFLFQPLIFVILKTYFLTIEYE